MRYLYHFLLTIENKPSLISIEAENGTDAIIEARLRGTNPIKLFITRSLAVNQS